MRVTSWEYKSSQIPGEKSVCTDFQRVQLLSSMSVLHPGLRAVGCGGAQEMRRHDLTPLALLGGQAYPEEKGAGQKVS